MAQESGRLAVELAAAQRRPSTVLTRASFHNAIVALAAVGGSTNAVVHLLAIAGRLGIDLTLDDFDRRARVCPLLVDLNPAGRFLMEDFHRAGGLLAVLAQVEDLLDPQARTVTGRTLSTMSETLRPGTAPSSGRGKSRCRADAGIAVLRGSLAPDGALVKPAAASAQLLRHRGRAVVFDSVEDLKARLDDPRLDVDEDSVLVLRGCGPRGYPGMPEVGTCRCRRSCWPRAYATWCASATGRMSGTAYGTVVLHAAPEAAVGGPLALLRDGDPVVLDVATRRLDVDVPAKDWARRQARGAHAGRAGLRRPRLGGASTVEPGHAGPPRCRPRLSWWGPAATGHPRVALGRTAAKRGPRPWSATSFKSPVRCHSPGRGR
jgi:dihydroxy-acid dehydratase